MHKIPTIAAYLVLAAATLASARPLTAKERGYTRALEQQLGLERVAAKALSSKSGAAGLKVSFEGLTVVRIHFPSAHAARRYAARPSPRSQRLRQVDLRGKEVVLLGGERLRDPADARTYLGAAWGASLDAPSVATQGSALVKRADGSVIRLRPLTRRPRAEPAPAPTAATLAGTYYLIGSSRVVIDQVQAGPDGIKCRVTFADKGTDSRSFPGVFDGQVLVLELRAHGAKTLGQHQAREVTYVWAPNARDGAAFVRSGAKSELLPYASERFWHAKGY